MKITLREYGGLAAAMRLGGKVRATVEDGTLPAPLRAELLRLVAAAKAAISVAAARPKGADRMSHAVVIEEDGQVLELPVPEPGSASAVNELRQWLVRNAGAGTGGR